MPNPLNEAIFWERRSGYGIYQTEYKDNFSLQAGNRTENGNYLDWVFLSKWSQAKGGFVPDEKKRPMGVYFGNREQEIEGLKFFLKELGAKP